ncbi:cell cycle checkpoint [Ramicandelaber brevisporus]|nr:cell cycle checkpoint [Ramicandelaber brevisporus]
MRFKTRVSNVHVLTKVLGSIDKLAKQCALRLTPTRIYFVVLGEAQGSMQVWSQLSVDLIFTEYRIESVTNNEIYLEIPVDTMLRALRSVQSLANTSFGGGDTVIRLTKNGLQPIFIISASMQSRAGKPLELVQEVPIRLLSATQMGNIREPMVPEPQVHIMMPPLLGLRSIAERLRSISDAIIISANMDGELILRGESEFVHVETAFQGLINPEMDMNASSQSTVTSGNQGDANDIGSNSSSDNSNSNSNTRDQRVPLSSARDKQKFAEARVDLRSFIKFLHSYHVTPSNVVCCIIEGHALVLYVYINSGIGFGSDFSQQTRGVLTYYLPIRLA